MSNPASSHDGQGGGKTTKESEVREKLEREHDTIRRQELLRNNLFDTIDS